MNPDRIFRLLRHLLILGLGLGVGALPAWSATQVLYDPAVTNTDPAQTGWLDGAVVGGSASYSTQGVLITPANIGATAGYSNYPVLLRFVDGLPPVNHAFPALLGSAGYRLSFGFGMSPDTENHSGNPDRAGFSVILIGDDKKGVEIGFQNNRIFAQNLVSNAFVAGEETRNAGHVAAAFSPNRWDLTVIGNAYALTLGNQTVLSGALHDYSSYSGGGANAYHTPNFIFLGDNTTSAGATFLLDYAAISTPVPEPSMHLMLLAGLAVLGVRAARRGRRY